MTRPFFSIIIPCYNTKPEDIKNLLNSIDNNCSISNIEIIIVDDRSTDNTYLKEVEKFKKKTYWEHNYDIKIIDTPNNVDHCPGNAREAGVKIATGIWLTFADSDDLFTNRAFDTVRNIILNQGEKYIIESDVKIYNIESDAFDQDIGSPIWLHGKFYNRDNLWEKYDIHFKTNLKYYEDMYVNYTIKCILTENNINTYHKTQEPIYIWRQSSNSFSGGLNNVKYQYDNFKDFIDASYMVYYNRYNKLKKENNINEAIIDYYKSVQVNCILYGYFFLQVFIYNKFNCDIIILIVNQMVREICKEFNMNSEQLIDFIDNIDCFEKRGTWYNNIRNDVIFTSCNFMESESFYSFINNILN